MPKCGSQPTQTSRHTGAQPGLALNRAVSVAREEAKQACLSESCNKGNCIYTEAKVVGSIWSDADQKKWTCEQTTSGKCSCSEEKEPAKPCKREIEQRATCYGSSPLEAGKHARDIARQNAELVCASGKCPDPKGVTNPNKCIYKETKINGDTWQDATSGKYISKQTTIGTCECEGEWF